MYNNFFFELPVEDHVRQSAFKRGMVISIKHVLMFEPALSVIQKVDDGCVYFRIPDAFLKNNVLKGDSVTIQIFSREHEFVVQGMISDIDIQYPRLVQVTLDKIFKYKNYRKAKRFAVNFQANVQIQGLEDNIYAVIKNMSTTGISAVFKEHINIEAMVSVKVSMSIANEQFLRFKAKVVRAIPRVNFNEYGMEIVEIDEINKDNYDKLIFNLMENERLFISECLK